MNYYNDSSKHCCQWLQALAKKGAIPKGKIDNRSIKDVNAIDLKSYNQCHFFAGIGGWQYALQLARVPSDFPVWTGSCPCQPFSTAGKQKGIRDDRHLWPKFFSLIQKCRPPIIFGEQVASKAAFAWWDSVANDLERIFYATTAISLCAASVGAPHIRQRLFWVAYSLDERRSPWLSAWMQGMEQEKRKCSTSEFYPWSEIEKLEYFDGRSLPIKPSLCPLVNGIPEGMGRSWKANLNKMIHGYGNAIVPQVAAEFIKASLEAIIEQQT